MLEGAGVMIERFEPGEVEGCGGMIRQEQVLRWGGAGRNAGTRVRRLWRTCLESFGSFESAEILKVPKGSQGLRKFFGGFRSHLEGSETVLLEEEFEKN